MTGLLTEEQIKAAHSDAKTTLCPAAAGSGKTRVLMERIQWLLDGRALPHELCVVTFTQAAAKEMSDRHRRGIIPTTLGHLGTLHALLLRLLREHGHLIGLPPDVTVMPQEEALFELLAIAGSLKVKVTQKLLKESVEFQLYSEPGSTVRGIAKEHIVAKEYIRKMRETGELSYDALLCFGHRLALKHPEVFPFKHLLVDEYQDSAVLDCRIYEAMKTQTAFFVGDYRQSIYGFRGASLAGFRALAADPQIANRPISTNFRSAQEIVAAANRLFPGSECRPGALQGEVQVWKFADAAQELSAVTMAVASLPQDSSMAVLLRTNRAADRFKAALASFLPDVPQTPQDEQGEYLGKLMLKAMVAPNNEGALIRFLVETFGSSYTEKLSKKAALESTSLKAQTGLGDVRHVAILEPDDAAAAAFQFCSHNDLKPAAFWLQNLATTVPLPCSLADLLLASFATKEEVKPSLRIHVGTIHSAKGLEWDHVWLPAFEDEAIPGNKTDKDLEEERRVAYVALTRARISCVMSWCEKRQNDYVAHRFESRRLSRFALEMTNG